ncbi:hypothetical protein lbkm_3462 [Lachnospiraceae bacterium KM106-2]|nr:hypothetical protein lbkm_3462 [Lachnospiraceae bacterium KM106-2]
MDEKNLILDTNITQFPQASGYGKTLMEVFVIVKVTDVISPTETRSFLLSTTLYAKNNSYLLSNIVSGKDINDEGYINLGTVYIQGPIKRSDISHHTTLSFIIPTATD